MSPMAFGAMLSISETRKVDLKGAYVSQNPNPLSTIAPWNMVACGYAETTMQMMFGALIATKPDLPKPQRAVALCKIPMSSSRSAGYRIPGGEDSMRHQSGISGVLG